MKATLLIMLTFFLGKSCEENSAKEMQGTIIEYTANTRGFYSRITAEDGNVRISKDRSNTETPRTVQLSESQQKAFADAFKEIDLDNMQNLKAPSEKRFYDGAAIGDLKITYKGKLYKSQSFDHMDPPAGIAKLVNLMAEYTKNE